jgi:hypothetical protein
LILPSRLAAGNRVLEIEVIARVRHSVTANFHWVIFNAKVMIFTKLIVGLSLLRLFLSSAISIAFRCNNLFQLFTFVAAAGLFLD